MCVQICAHFVLSFCLFSFSIAIIKPDAVKKGNDEAIIKRITDAGSVES